MRRDYRVTSHKVVCSSVPVPARDRIIDFGKYKGRMLGTLPSKYLTWVSRNLRARDFLEWAKLADEVLKDPIYRDRIEWESAERILTGNSGRLSDSPVSDLLEISESFGWDNDDKAGWGCINFELLGTSKGGRIPRKDGTAGNGLANKGINKSGSAGYVHNISANQRRKERAQSFREISIAKASSFGLSQTHVTKDQGLLEASSYVSRWFKIFDSRRVSSIKENKVDVLTQVNKMSTKEVDGFEDSLTERRQQRRVKQNLRKQQFHISDRDVGIVGDGKNSVMDVMVTKQNDRSNLNRTSNPFPGRDAILKKINR